MLSEQGLFPEWFGSQSRLGRHGGLILTTALVLLVANFVRSLGDRVRRECRLALGLPAHAVIAVVLAFFAVDTIRNDPWSFVAIVLIALASVVLDAVFRRSDAVPEPESV